MWEARKIWSGIIYDSRTWGSLVISFIRKNNEQSLTELNNIKQRLIYRHLAWIYTHRIQLLQPMSWEQQGTTGHIAKTAKRFEKSFGIGAITGNVELEDVHQFLSDNEFTKMKEYKNMATQLIAEQSKDIN